MNNSWQRRALDFLDSIDVNDVKNEKLQWSDVCAVAGKSRITLWRNAEIKGRYTDIKCALQGSKLENLFEVKNKKTDESKFSNMQTKNKQLESKNQRLCEIIIKMYECLDSHGVDPVSFLIDAGFDLDELE